MSAESTPKPVELLREKPNILFHSNPNRTGQVLYQDESVVVTKATDIRIVDMKTLGMCTPDLPSIAAHMPQLYYQPPETITVSDAKTGLENYRMRYMRDLLGRPVVQEVTVWDYLATSDEGKDTGQPIVGIKKTELMPHILGYTRKEVLSELPLYPPKKDIVDDTQLPRKIQETWKWHIKKDPDTIKVVNDVIEQLRRLGGELGDLKKSKKYPKE